MPGAPGLNDAEARCSPLIDLGTKTTSLGGLRISVNVVYDRQRVGENLRWGWSALLLLPISPEVDGETNEG